MFIGSFEIKGYAALAPMAGVADRAFREICRGFGAAYTVGELTSSKGIVLGDRKSDLLLAAHEKERPFASQLFGSDPEIMAKAAEKALAYSPDFIDINMGCPAPKVAIAGKGGSALMKDPKLAEEIVRKVAAVSTVPVTVKMRTGWDEDTVNAVELAKRVENAGAAAVTVHGRTRAQMYAPPVDTETIAAVKSAVSIPVIANGDIFSAHDAAKMYEQTGCDLVMVGRGAMGNPWIFAEINALMSSESLLPEPPLSEKLRVMLKQIELMTEYKGERTAMLEARKHTAWYMKGLKGAATIRRKCGEISSFDDILEICNTALQSNQN